MEIAPGVHRLTQGVPNFYLIEERGKLVVVDAGSKGDWHLLVRTLAALGRRLDDLEAILLTHAHADHTGFAERARTTAGVAVWIHGADAPVAGGTKPEKNEGQIRAYVLKAEFWRSLFSLVRRGGVKIVPIHELSTFADGDRIALPGRPLVIHAPGHTPGHSALFLESRRVLFTGDAIVTRNPLTGRIGPQIMPSAFNRDSRQALRSLEAFRDLEVDVILPGHGEPWREGAAKAVSLAREAGAS